MTILQAIKHKEMTHMKTTHRTTHISSMAASVLAIVMLALCSVWLAPATPALAAAGTPQPKAAADGTQLKNAYEREQKALATQTGNLAKAGEGAAKVQTLIDAQKAQGVDTSAIEAALATAKFQVANAQSAHDTAASILSAHAGFDASGNVTDVAQARQTITSARQSLIDAHTILQQARQDLEAALKAFRQTQVQVNRLAREQEWLALQQTRLDGTAQIVAKTQVYIANQKSKGKDTASLEAALATFQQQIATAQASHKTAADILSAHAGFNASGKVTDPVQAHQTLTGAHQSLSDAHQILQQAGQDLRKAIKTYRDANEPEAKPTTVP
jgi:hypothetical protein